MPKRKHADLIKAWADNEDLVVYVKTCDNDAWMQCERLTYWWEGNEYFASLPQHKEACLHWLNGGEIQYTHTKVHNGWGIIDTLDDEIHEEAERLEYPPEELEDFNPCGWTPDSIFMSKAYIMRIKPKQKKRWIVLGGLLLVASVTLMLM